MQDIVTGKENSGQIGFIYNLCLLFIEPYNITKSRAREDLLICRHFSNLLLCIVLTCIVLTISNQKQGNCIHRSLKLIYNSFIIFTEPCFFDVPKCPFTDLFDRPTTTMTTHAPTTTASTTTSQDTPDVASTDTNIATTPKTPVTTVTNTKLAAQKIKKQIDHTILVPTSPKLAKHSDDTSRCQSLELDPPPHPFVTVCNN